MLYYQETIEEMQKTLKILQKLTIVILQKRYGKDFIENKLHRITKKFNSLHDEFNILKKD